MNSRSVRRPVTGSRTGSRIGRLKNDQARLCMVVVPTGIRGQRITGRELTRDPIRVRRRKHGPMAGRQNGSTVVRNARRLKRQELETPLQASRPLRTTVRQALAAPPKVAVPDRHVLKRIARARKCPGFFLCAVLPSARR